MPMWVGIDYFSGVKNSRKYFCRKNMYFQKTENDFCQTGEEKYDTRKVAQDVPKIKLCCKLLCEKETWYF